MKHIIIGKTRSDAHATLKMMGEDPAGWVVIAMNQGKQSTRGFCLVAATFTAAALLDSRLADFVGEMAPGLHAVPQAQVRSFV